MKAIETRYRGYRFRSRIEARWAVFFDTLGLKWEYEPEGFDLGDGIYYLPDFRVTSPQGLVSWYEIKRPDFGPCPKLSRMRRLYESQLGLDKSPSESFLTLDNYPTEILLGGLRNVCPRCGTLTEGEWHSHGDESEIYCHICDQNTPSGSNDTYEIGAMCPVRPHKGSIYISNSDMRDLLARVRHACEMSRSARFDHGGAK